ncbi:uncharacterized protein N7477_005591 [Penicillium maclennaniae]|uniref:uncharacterized protein n=1 Tax=Penicillium maclennaniae TaxID=1343394 RepID=UPI0025425C2A|nr:uncharacterized protein N7477_005591 [Penicillium maclennaniae]KAJ5670228.1 hypothetical protein N7477_005591 [Penicillium maclennaniae]
MATNGTDEFDIAKVSGRFIALTPISLSLAIPSPTPGSSHLGHGGAPFARPQSQWRGETTASALENHLSALEGKVDDLLALFEVQSSTQGDIGAPNSGLSNEQELNLKSEERKP